jgi:hypothetical protein
MNCCMNCFSDTQIITVIATTGIIGDCDFCESKSIKILDCECDEINTHFSPLFDLYTVSSESSSLLQEHLITYWPGLFNLNLDAKARKYLINTIGRSYSGYSKELFENPVSFVSERYELSPQELDVQWDDFAKEIKENNRFFIRNKIDLETIGSYLVRLVKTYSVGKCFYRARQSGEKLKLHQLGKPPQNLTFSGRANPVGIPYLYVSGSQTTTVHETRSSRYDRLTVGKFRLQEPLQVISLRQIEAIGPFEIQAKSFELEEFINIRPFLIRLQNELSKPIRKQDAQLDYLPTQYLCEYIKFMGFDAIEYDSAMHKDGFNLAVFSDHKLICKSSEFLDVTDVNYTVDEIKIIKKKSKSSHN